MGGCLVGCSVGVMLDSMLLVDCDDTALASSLGVRLLDRYVSSGSVRSLCLGGAVPCLLSAAALLALTMVLKCLLQVWR